MQCGILALPRPICVAAMSLQRGPCFVELLPKRVVLTLAERKGCILFQPTTKYSKKPFADDCRCEPRRRSRNESLTVLHAVWRFAEFDALNL